MILIGKDGPNSLGVTAAKSGRTKNFSELVDSAVMPGVQGGPLMHIIAAKAVAFKEALEPAFGAYQRQIVANARELSRVLMAGGVRIVSGGTDNHLMLADVTPFGLSGKEAEKLLDAANITVNKNGIPFDTKSPLVTSGIRVGTPAVTTRGMKEPEMQQIGQFILDVLKSGGNDGTIAGIREKVASFCTGYPLHA
jgi:glycine hydroxymethyltransferase